MASVILRDGRAADVVPVHRWSEDMVIRTRMRGAWEMKRAGVQVKYIAKHYGVTRQTIYNWINFLSRNGLVAS
jgi:transposase